MVQNVNSNLLVMGFGLILVFLLALLISLCNPYMYSLFCSNYRRILKRKLILKILRSIRHNTLKLKLSL